MELRDYTEYDKVSEVRAKAKADFEAEFMEFLESRYEVVKKVLTEQNSKEIAVVVGTAKEPETGYSMDLVISIRSAVKNWYDKPSASGKRDVVRFDIDEAAEAYEFEMAHSKRKGRPKSADKKKESVD